MLTGVEKKHVIRQHEDHMSNSSIIIDERRVWTFCKDQCRCQEMLALFVMHWTRWGHLTSTNDDKLVCFVSVSLSIGG